MCDRIIYMSVTKEIQLMGRKKTKTDVMMGGKFPLDLSTKFQSLSMANGISIREALRRLMVDAIMQNRIPGIDAMELDARREVEKYGREAVAPTYDGEQERKPGVGRVNPVPHAE